MTRTPLVHASILRFEGHASVFLPYEGPATAASSRSRRRPTWRRPAARRVLGVLCGVMGNIQANEAIKVLLGIGETRLGLPPHTTPSR